MARPTEQIDINRVLRKTWRKGQIWESRLLRYPDSPWELVGGDGKQEPLWGNYAEYRQRPGKEGDQE